MDRERANEELRQSHARFSTAFRASPAPTSISTLAEGRYLCVNDAFLRMLGYTEDELVGRTAVDLGFWESDAERQRAILQLRTEGSLRDFEAGVRRKNGELRQITISLDLVDLDGQACLLGFCHDITERKRVEAALRESQAFLETAQAVAHIGSWVQELVPQDRLWWSRETYRIFGVEAAAFRGTSESFFALLHEDDREEVRRASASALESAKPYSLEHRIVRPDGSVRWVHEQAEVTRDASGRPLRMIGTVQDLTERKQLEEQFHQAQKMEAVGRLAGGVAHDFNNMLGVILGYSELMLGRLSPEDPVWRHAQAIQKTSQRAAALTHQLLAFSRRQVLQPTVLDLSAVVAGMESLLRRLIGEDVELRASAPCALGLVRADRGQLEQVLMNLVVNARDAMPSGGKITIETANVTLDDAYAAEHPGVQPGPHVMVAVTDTGVGMDAETRRHMFEPFFTTKSRGKGTGLGLATAYGIVRQSGGHIFVYSEPAHGASFKVYLPRVVGTAETAAAPVAPTASPGGSETILLVEDEDGLREVAREVLAELGYAVLEAASAPAAREVAAHHGGRIDLLLTDVVMPGGSGPELARNLAATRPETKALFMSGYTDDAIGHLGVLEKDVAFLQKPFTSDVLARKVREVLEART